MRSHGVRLARAIQVKGFAAYLRSVNWTSSVAVDCDVRGSALVGFWHEAMFCLLAAAIGRQDVAIYIRAQPFIRQTLNLLSELGVHAIVSDHRGTSGVKEARDWLAVPGRVLAISMDMGTPRVVLPGVVRFSRMIGVPLHPLAVSVTSGYRLAQWDRCVVPFAGAELSVRALEPVETRDAPTNGAHAIQDALSEPTLSASRGEAAAWGRFLAPWSRACLTPVARTRLSVWADGALREFSP